MENEPIEQPAAQPELPAQNPAETPAQTPDEEPALYVQDYGTSEIIEEGAPDFLSELRTSFWD